MTIDRRHEDRLARLREALAVAGISHLWIEPSVNFTYLTGLALLSIERMTGLVVSSGELKLVVPRMLAQECEELDAEMFDWDDAHGPEPAVAAALEGVDVLHIQGSLPAWAWDLLRRTASARIELDAGVVEGLREVKDDEEVALLRRSGRVTDDAVAWLARQDLAGVTEIELAKRLQIHYMEQGHVPFDTPLVASGPNAAMPHYAGGDVEIDTSAPLLLDFGCSVGGYWSDITRVLFPRETDDEVQAIYEVVCAAADAAFDAVAPGVPCSAIDAAARSVIEEAGYGDAFIHRTGHGLGLEMHEPPYIRGGNDAPLQVGHVFSIEPGIYLPGRLGLRYENIVYLGPGAPELLNNAPRVNYMGANAHP